MHGYGIYRWQDGRLYEGEYFNDKKHGDGRYVWADGRQYIGQWANGKQHGVGRYILPSGQERTGRWENGKRISWEQPVSSTVSNADITSSRDK